MGVLKKNYAKSDVGAYIGIIFILSSVVPIISNKNHNKLINFIINFIINFLTVFDLFL